MTDSLCLPRPISPPVYRRPTTSSINLEYGFPSTHSSLAFTIATFGSLFYGAYWSRDAETDRVVYISLLMFAIGMAFSRVFTGLHSFLDVVSGSVIGVVYSWVHWKYVMVPIEFGLVEGIWLPMSSTLAGLILLVIQPDPLHYCPCFKDSVASMSAIIGLLLGSWFNGRLPIYEFTVGLTFDVLRILCGVIGLVIWELASKPLLMTVLNPFYSQDSSETDKDDEKKNGYKIERFGKDTIRTLIKYIGVGWWVVYGSSKLFCVLGI
ncbi:hypothetical protein HK098_000286 [Nowakowskiella sp. JEL0407]|nr:hypothetical protein HK098_000286 [Nowakowskiella sp. JEL0407]